MKCNFFKLHGHGSYMSLTHRNVESPPIVGDEVTMEGGTYEVRRRELDLFVSPPSYHIYLVEKVFDEGERTQ